MNNIDLQAIILAAGQGLRLRPFTEDLPKCLIEVDDNKTLLDLSIEKISQAGIKNILIVIGHEGDKIIKRYPNKYENLEIQYIHNKEYLTSGTMQSLASAGNSIKRNFLLFEADLLYDIQIITALIDSKHSNVIFAGKPLNAGDDVLISVDPDTPKLVRDVGKSIGTDNLLKGSFIGISKISLAFAKSAINEWFQKYKKINSYYCYEEIFAKVSDKMNSRQDKLYTLLNQDLRWAEIDKEKDFEIIPILFTT